MKNLLTNPIKYNRIITIEALMLTIAIHVAFLLLFSVKKPIRSEENLEDVSVSILNINSLNAAERAEIDYILKNYNPTLMTRGNSPYGFEAIVKKQATNSFIDEDLTTSNSDKYMISYDDISLKNIKQRDINIDSSKLNNLIGFTPIKNDKFDMDYPIVYGSDNSIFKLDLTEQQHQLIEKYLVKNSVYKVVKDQDDFIRINIINSSDRRDFDLIIAKYLNDYLVKNPQASDEVIYTVFYNKEVE